MTVAPKFPIVAFTLVTVVVISMHKPVWLMLFFHHLLLPYNKLKTQDVLTKSQEKGDTRFFIRTLITLLVLDFLKNFSKF